MSRTDIELLLEMPGRELDRLLPKLAKDEAFIASIREYVARLPATAAIRQGDARNLSRIPDASIPLIVTSPPYWNLKEYVDKDGQLGHIDDYEGFHDELDKAWRECARVLAPGGRLVVVVGDVVVSRRRFGRHKNFPLHAEIQTRCDRLGLDNLTPILWSKIANARFEAKGNSGAFLGKPFEPGAVVKNNVEFILMFRKPGGRSPAPDKRALSLISAAEHRQWFTQVWADIQGASTKDHPAPYPEALADRLIRMFSFVGDTVLDPFAGSGTTLVAAMRSGRNAIGIELEPTYIAQAQKRLKEARKRAEHQGGIKKSAVRGKRPALAG